MSRGKQLIVLMVLSGLVFSVGAPVAWVGPAFVLTWITLIGAGLAWLPRRLLTVETAIPAVLGVAGVASAWLLWTASAYLTKGLVAGSVAVVAAGAAGWARALRDRELRANLWRSIDSPTFWVLAAALLIGYYLAGLNGIWTTDDVWFTFRYDWNAHLHVAGMVSELGLPKVELTGSARYPFARLNHVGWPVLVAGVENLTRTTLFAAARILGVGLYALLALGSYAIAARYLERVAARIAVALAPLAWGGGGIALALLRGDVPAILDLKHGGDTSIMVISGVMSYSMTQLAAVTFVLVGLAVLGLRRDDEQPALAELSAGFGLIAVSAAIKPSLVIVIVPASVIVLIAARRWSALGVLLAACAGVGAIYFLPVLLAPAELPPSAGWVTGWPRDAEKIFTRIIGAVGGLWVVLAIWLIRSLGVLRTRAIDPRAILAIALVGAFVFAAFFHEAHRHHGNQNWPLLGTLVLVAPYALITAIKLRNSWARLAVGGLLALHVIAGVIYALNAPGYRVRRLSVDTVFEVEAMRDLTPADARVHIDPSVSTLLRPYLRRRAAFTRPKIHSERPAYKRWTETARRKRAFAPEVVAQREAVILLPRSYHLRKPLRRLGWRRAFSGPRSGLELWLAPGVSNDR